MLKWAAYFLAARYSFYRIDKNNNHAKIKIYKHHGGWDAEIKMAEHKNISIKLICVCRYAFFVLPREVFFICLH